MLSFGTRKKIRDTLSFKRVLVEGRKFSSGFFSVYLLFQAKGRKLGLSVSKRVGNAAVRNRLKRRVREIFRVNQLDLKPCFQVVVLKTAAASLSFEQCQSELKALWQKAGALRSGSLEEKAEQG